MQIISDFKKDGATPSKKPGGYEWWYFDAVDVTSGYSLVVIFYQGNPFSNRYIRQLKKEPSAAASNPENFPAISISIYKNNEPVYYSFTEFAKSETSFSTEVPFVQIGGHSLTSEILEEELIYELKLQEILPSGDSIEAELTFSSPDLALNVPGHQSAGKKSEGHFWNLIQPRAEVQGTIQLSCEADIRQVVRFHGEGYHDHNTGQEPMKDEFRDWYWGRFHFPVYTLVYYVMNRQHRQQHRAWLIDEKSRSVIEKFENVQLKDRGSTIFGLQSARKLVLRNGQSEITVQQSELLDNGPFYQRFLSDAFLSLDGRDIQKSRGISEYIHPARIYWKLFWPFVDMRIWYKDEKPHWVQKSKILYRWTW